MNIVDLCQQASTSAVKSPNQPCPNITNTNTTPATSTNTSTANAPVPGVAQTLAHLGGRGSMLAAMLMYVLSDNEFLQPGGGTKRNARRACAGGRRISTLAVRQGTGSPLVISWVNCGYLPEVPPCAWRQTIDEVQSFMRVLVSGASGLIGKRLVRSLGIAGHSVGRLVRDPRRPGRTTFSGTRETGEIDAAKIDSADAVVNLAGETIASRWYAEKEAPHPRQPHRRHPTIAKASPAGPARSRWVNASAVGYYGNRGDEPLDQLKFAGQRRLLVRGLPGLGSRGRNLLCGQACESRLSASAWCCPATGW